MANSKNKKPTTNQEEADKTAPQPEEAPDYPVRPGSQGQDVPLDEQLIKEWDQQNPPDLDRLLEEELHASVMDENGEESPDVIHSDAYKRVSTDEFDEFDSLLDDETAPSSQPAEDDSPPLLKLLEDEEVEEIERIFQDEQQVGTEGHFEPAVEPPIEAEEETTMEDELLPEENTPELYLENEEEPPPDFEDRGMGGGFFVAEDELQPTTESRPEEVEFYPPPETNEEEEGSSTSFASDIFFPPGPTMEIHAPPTVVGDLPPDNTIMEKEVTDDRVSKLMYRAEMARRRINDEIDSIELARDLLELIRSSNTLILSGKDNYEEADRSLNEVEFRLSYSRRVKVWSEDIAYRLLAYEVFWLLILGLGALFIPSLLSAMLSQLKEISPASLPDFIMMDDLFLGVSTALWGGLGGVVGAMYSLWHHVSMKQDFNPQHKMWYYTQPIMGIPIGVVIFLVVRIGIGFTIDGVLDIASPYGIYMLAWIAGFQQNFLYEIIRQIVKLFRIGK